MHQKEVCEICLHTITNPVCIDCYLKHAYYWMRDLGLDRKAIAENIRRIREILPAETMNEHKCIICKNNRVAVCTYCAFLKTSKIVLEIASGKNVDAFRAGQEIHEESLPIFLR